VVPAAGVVAFATILEVVALVDLTTGGVGVVCVAAAATGVTVGLTVIICGLATLADEADGLGEAGL
jgi:phosphoenolpyruvate synthase/pyruvate phosphate dikinase